MEQFIKAASTADLAPGQAKCVAVAGKKIALFNLEGSFYAIDDTCTHRGGVDPGRLVGVRPGGVERLTWRRVTPGQQLPDDARAVEPEEHREGQAAGASAWSRLADGLAAPEEARAGGGRRRAAPTTLNSGSDGRHIKTELLADGDEGERPARVVRVEPSLNRGESTQPPAVGHSNVLLVVRERDCQDCSHQPLLGQERIRLWANELRREKLVLYDYDPRLHLASSLYHKTRSGGWGRMRPRSNAQRSESREPPGVTTPDPSLIPTVRSEARRDSLRLGVGCVVAPRPRGESHERVSLC